MKISYVLQLKDFSIMLGIGFLLGVFYGIINIANRIKRLLLIQIICDLIFSIVAFGTLIIFVNIINMGEMRFFLIMGYIIGFTLERITLGKIFAKGYLNVYNKLCKLWKKFLTSKLGKVIFK